MTGRWMVLAALAGTACGAPAAPAASNTNLTAPPASTPTSVPTTVRAAAPSAPPAPAEASTIYTRLQPDLARCYEQGKRSTPEMLDGKLTLNATLDASGRPSCVIVSEDTGFTQEVEDCMAARLSNERFEPGAASTALAIPVVVRKGALQLGERSASQLLVETVETRNMPDAFELIESLLPALQSCVSSVDRSGGSRSVLVAARIGPDGRPHCALASSASVLPPNVADCASAVLRGAKFPAPKRGGGVVIVPLNLPRTN